MFLVPRSASGQVLMIIFEVMVVALALYGVLRLLVMVV